MEPQVHFQTPAGFNLHMKIVNEDTACWPSTGVVGTIARSGKYIEKESRHRTYNTAKNAFLSQSGYHYCMHVALRVAYSLHPAYPHALSARRLGIIELPTVTPLFVLYLSRLFYTCHIALHRNTSSLSILSVCALISFRCCGENPEKVDIDLLAHQPMSLTGSGHRLSPKLNSLPTAADGVSNFDETTTL